MGEISRIFMAYLGMVSMTGGSSESEKRFQLDREILDFIFKKMEEYIENGDIEPEDSLYVPVEVFISLAISAIDGVVPGDNVEEKIDGMAQIGLSEMMAEVEKSLILQQLRETKEEKRTGMEENMTNNYIR